MRRSRRVTPAGPRWRALICAGLVAAILIGSPGCRARRRAREPRFEPIERRVDHTAGRSLVLPVTVQGPVDPTRRVRALLDDGRSVPTELNWISVAPDERGGWLPAAGRWSATPASADTRPPGLGSWCLVLAIPPDSIGQGIWVGRRRIALNWLADPPLRVPEGAPSPWNPPEGLNPAALAESLEEERRSPLDRWRSRLLTRGLEPPDPVAGIASASERAPEPDRFEDGALEALANQVEARWRIALARLWRADPEVADGVKRRLLAVVDFGSGAIAPAWPTDREQLDTLLADLLNPRLKEAERADRAGAWLAAQPVGAAWIIDDAGARDGATGGTVVTAGLANLSDRATLGWADTDPPGVSPDLVPVEPLTARRVVVVAPPDTGAGRAPRGTTLGLHLGRWSVTRAAATEPIPVRPPGFRLEPFFEDWTLDTWLSAAADSLAVFDRPSDWATTALVLRDDAPADRASDPRWSLHLECRTPGLASLPGPRTDAIRVWIGPFGRPRHVIRVTSAGDAVDRHPAAPERGGGGRPVAGVHVSRHDDRWICRIPLPAGAVESDGTIRLSVERIDARAVRSAWPRPLLPWQLEPGRIALDTRAWSTVGVIPGPR